MIGISGVEDPAGDLAWHTISGQLAKVRRIWALGPLAVALVVAGLVARASSAATAVIAAVAVALYVWSWFLVERNARSWRYAERAEDLIIRHGVLFRTEVVVPYGRMQFVDVKSGPLERKFGIATVQLHTASAATDAKIRGATPDEAQRLRDQLSALGEARLSGL